MSGSSSKLTYPSFPSVRSHAGRNTFWADPTSSSSSAHAIWSSVRPCPMSSPIRPSKCPRPMIFETMVGFEVAPVTPHARFFWSSSGSTPSSQTFVPVAMSDASDMMNSC